MEVVDYWVIQMWHVIFLSSYKHPLFSFHIDPILPLIPKVMCSLQNKKFEEKNWRKIQFNQYHD